MRKQFIFPLLVSVLVFLAFVVLSFNLFGGDDDNLLVDATRIAQGLDGTAVVITVEVTRLVTVVVTPTFTPVPTLPPPEVMVDDDAFLGAEDAPVKIVEFSDYRCGFCRRFYHETLFQLTDHYGDSIQFVYRDFPIFGEESINSALAAECAGDQDAFWDYHNAIFDSQSLEVPLTLDEAALLSMAESLDLDLESWQECFTSDAAYDEVVVDAVSAQNWGITGTPTFFVNGRRLVGAQPLEAFFQVIDAELVALGIEPPPRPETDAEESG